MRPVHRRLVAGTLLSCTSDIRDFGHWLDVCFTAGFLPAPVAHRSLPSVPLREPGSAKNFGGFWGKIKLAFLNVESSHFYEYPLSNILKYVW